MGLLKNTKSIYGSARLVMKMADSPWHILRCAKQFFNVNFLGKDQLRFVELFVTLACNASCDFCSNGLFSSKKTTLDHEDFIRVIDQCAALEVPVVCLIGGEPMLYKKLNTLIQRITGHGLLASIATNGTLLTQDNVRDLAANGLKMLAISLHSLKPEEHDSVYKIKGAFKTAMDARVYCEDNGILYSLSAVVRHSDFVSGRFDRMMSWAIEHKTPIGVNPIIPTGFALNSAMSDLVRPEEFAQLNKIACESEYVSTHMTTNYFGYGCPAGNSYIGITANGSILPCFFFPVSIGNAKEMDLRIAWNRYRQMPLFKRRHDTCLCAIDKQFIEQYLIPLYESGAEVPIPVEQHPKYDDLIQGLVDL